MGMEIFFAFVAASGSRDASQIEGRKDFMKYEQILDANVPQSVKESETERRPVSAKGCISSMGGVTERK